MSWASCFYTPGGSRIIQKSFGFDLLFFWAMTALLMNRACSLGPTGEYRSLVVSVVQWLDCLLGYRVRKATVAPREDRGLSIR